MLERTAADSSATRSQGGLDAIRVDRRPGSHAENPTRVAGSRLAGALADSLDVDDVSQRKRERLVTVAAHGIPLEARGRRARLDCAAFPRKRGQ